MSPVIKHGADASEISFLLSSINDDAFEALKEAKRKTASVRLRSPRTPLHLLITDLERVKGGVRITGRIARRTTPSF